MPRRNLCPNPALGAPGAPDDTGWSPGDGAGSAVAVTGFGRANAYRVTSGSFCKTPRSAVTVGQAYTVSLYGRSLTAADDTVQFVLQWLRSDDSVISSVGGAVPGGFPAAGTIIRCAATGTAPATAARCEAVLFDYNATFSSIELTEVLVDQVAALGDYADGETVGWAWDGTSGLSTSTEATTTGQMDATAPAAAAALTGEVRNPATLVTTAPLPTTTATGTGTTAGTLGAMAPLPVAGLAGSVTATGQLTATAPLPVAALRDGSEVAWPPRAGSVTLTEVAVAGSVTLT